MHRRIIVRRGTPGWYYVDLFGWRPFERFMHGGWIALSPAWVRRHWANRR